MSDQTPRVKRRRREAMNAHFNDRNDKVGVFSKDLQKYITYWGNPEGYSPGLSHHRSAEEARRIVKQYTPVRYESSDGFGDDCGGWMHGPDYSDQMEQGRDY